MKKVNILFCTAALTLFNAACNNSNSDKQDNADSFTITGQITGIPAGTVKLSSFNEEDRTSTVIDSVAIANNSFTLKGKIDGPQMMSLLIEPGNWSFPVFVENSHITVKADTSKASHYDQTAYGGTKGAAIKDYTIAGSKSQDDWMSYQNDAGLKKYKPVFATLEEAYKKADNKKDEEYKIKDQIDSVRKLSTELQKNWIDSFVSANPASAAGSYMFIDYYTFNNDMSLKDMQSLLNKFKGPGKATSYFKQMFNEVNKRKALQPDNMAPDFSLKKRDSSLFTLSTTRGQYVMLDFWASWCVPCRKAIPHWKIQYAKYHEKGFEIVSITNDNNWKNWLLALNQEKMPWKQVADEFPILNMPGRLQQAYMIPYLPCYILLDKEGRTILYNATEVQIDEKLKELFED